MTGWIVQGVPDLPLNLLRAVGCEFVVSVWERGRDEAFMSALVQYYSPFGKSYMICDSMAKCARVHALWPSVVPVYRNEPNLPDFDPMEPEEYAACARDLSRRGIAFAGPNISDFGKAQGWLSRFWAAMGTVRPSVIALHGYGLDPATLGTNAATLKRVYKRDVVFTEVGPDPHIADEQARAEWYLKAIRSSATVALYQAVDTGDHDGVISNSNWTRPWSLNGCGLALAKMLSASTAAPS